MLPEKAYFQVSIPKGLDVILNAISKEVLLKQPTEGEVLKVIAMYLKRELTVRETGGDSEIDKLIKKRGESEAATTQ